MNHYLLEATRWSAGFIASLGLTALVLAGLTTWLLVTDPVTASNAISTGDAEGLLRFIATTLIDIVLLLVGYL
jgi:hypothetical protein